MNPLANNDLKPAASHCQGHLRRSNARHYQEAHEPTHQLSEDKNGGKKVGQRRSKDDLEI
jgi:hypothetical protein